MEPLDYYLCDVFTDTPLTGNQLAVFPDAGHLSTEQMQAIARETNLSETTFLCRRDPALEAERGYRVRIFTVQEELRFAGHPTLGTASVIRRQIDPDPQAGLIRLELNAGIVPVAFDPVTFDDGKVTGGTAPKTHREAIWGEMTQPEASLGATHSRAALAPVLGLASEDFSPEWEPQTASTGMPFCIVPLRSVEALGRLRVHPGLGEEYLRASDAKFFYVIAREAAGQWRARMQFYNGEDPATGSAAGCATVYLVGNGIEPAGRLIHLRQGIEMQRPSDLYGRASLVEGKMSEVRVAGCTVLVAKGQLFLEQFT
jgi:trans-2,3-dihydro-3-hydroxyanthranilate isomerase